MSGAEYLIFRRTIGSTIPFRKKTDHHGSKSGWPPKREMQGAGKGQDRRVFPYARVWPFRSNAADSLHPKQAGSKWGEARRRKGAGSTRIPMRESLALSQQRRRFPASKTGWFKMGRCKAQERGRIDAYSHTRESGPFAATPQIPCIQNRLVQNGEMQGARKGQDRRVFPYARVWPFRSNAADPRFETACQKVFSGESPCFSRAASRSSST